MISYLIIAFFIIIISLGLFFLLKRGRGQKQAKTPYVDALHNLLEGKMDEALERLKRTVKKDTENVMAYIMLGDIFRKKGFPIRAAKIHRNLLVRGDLDNSAINNILNHLVLDYRASGILNKAIEMAERLAQRTKKNVDNQKLLLSLYEEKGDWDKAFYYRQSINKWLKRQDQDILALYKVHSGLSFIEQAAEREGRIRFREAIKLDKKCIPAYLNWGDSYRREGRDEDAYRVWREFTMKNPEWAHLAFNRLKEVLFDLGRYGEIEEIYQQIIQRKPKNPSVYLNLAELLEKQGKLDQAIEMCRKVTEMEPDSMRGRYLLVQILQKKGEETAALEESLRILDRERESSFCCSQCGFESSDPLWRCPQCHEWNSFLTEKTQ
jgi:lipopolysaccharide biosynthesis regulator YciM